MNVGSITSQGGTNCKPFDGRSSAWYSPSQALYVAGLMEQDVCSETTSLTSLEPDDPFHEDFYDPNLELLGFASFGLMRQFQVPWQHPTLDKPYGEFDDGHLPGAVEWGTSLQPNNGVHLNREEVSQALSFGETQLVVGILRRTEPDLDSLHFTTYGHFGGFDGVREIELPLHSIHLWEQEVKKLWQDSSGHRECAVTTIQLQRPDDTFSIHVVISWIEEQPPTVALTDLVDDGTVVSRSTVRLPSRVSKPMIFVALDLPVHQGDESIWKCGNRIIGGHERIDTFFGQYHRLLLHTGDQVSLMQVNLAATSSTDRHIGRGSPGGSSINEGSDYTSSYDESSGSDFDPERYGWDDELPEGLVKVACFKRGPMHASDPILSIVSMRNKDDLHDHLATLYRMPARFIKGIIHVAPEPTFAVEHRAWPIIVEQTQDRYDVLTQKLVVLQVEFYYSQANAGDIATQWRVVILPHLSSRADVIAATDDLNYCEALADSRCLVWHQGELWPQQGPNHIIRDGDLIRVAVPPIDEDMIESTWIRVQDTYDAGRLVGFPPDGSGDEDHVARSQVSRVPVTARHLTGKVKPRIAQDLIHYHNGHRVQRGANWALLQILRRNPLLTLPSTQVHSMNHNLNNYLTKKGSPQGTVASFDYALKIIFPQELHPLKSMLPFLSRHSSYPRSLEYGTLHSLDSSMTLTQRLRSQSLRNMHYVDKKYMMQLEFSIFSRMGRMTPAQAGWHGVL